MARKKIVKNSKKSAKTAKKEARAAAVPKPEYDPSSSKCQACGACQTALGP